MQYTRNTFRISLLLLLAIVLQGCKIGRFVVYNFADIKDHKKFPSRPLHHPNRHFSFYETRQQRIPAQITFSDGQTVNFQHYIKDNHTVAMLIIRNDSILYEQYFQGYNRSAVIPSFSTAKSIVSILIGCAIEDGLIGSVQDPVTKYIPEMKKNGFDQVTIEHLLQMTSGLKFNEGYANPFGEIATFYYGKRLRQATSKLKLESAPGQTFKYTSGNTQILGLILDKVLTDKTLTAYLQEKLWEPLGMEYDASWSIDTKKNGLEKTFCCINATARDFAKIGRLFLHKGNWNGRQIISEEWVHTSTKVDTTHGSAWFYQYQWWLPTPSGDYLTNGHHGQYIYVNPDKNLIIVRLGKKTGRVNWHHLFVDLAAAY